MTEYVNTEQNPAQCLDAKTVFHAGQRVQEQGKALILCVRKAHTESAYGKCKRTKGEVAGSCGGGEGDFCELTLVFPGVLFNSEDRNMESTKWR